MRIIISPTKTMKRKNYTDQQSELLFNEKALKLRSILEKFDKEKIKKDFKVSDKLTEKVFEYYQNPKDPIAAINLYEGLAFKNMNLDNLSATDFEYMQDHLYIMSAMYGALRPFDMISEYRLDYVMKFEINLYEFWKDYLEKLLKEEDFIVNLASNEFLNSVKHHNIINIHLLDEKGRNLSTQAKMGRGDMVSYIVKNKIKDPTELKKYNNMDYKYDKKRSDKNNYYFSKQ
ncbi:MAG: YaaA family protein [Erysipelothrix sp.]|nr:YaaA family protein [Erysipelothrix sp.]